MLDMYRELRQQQVHFKCMHTNSEHAMRNLQFVRQWKHISDKRLRWYFKLAMQCMQCVRKWLQLRWWLS